MSKFYFIEKKIKTTLMFSLALVTFNIKAQSNQKNMSKSEPCKGKT